MIEPLVRQCILQSEFAPLLAKYNGEPAISYQNAPNDKDPLWDNKKVMYPRIDYYIDWSYNAERKTAGTLEVNVWCLGEQEIVAEDVANDIAERLSDTFFNDGENIVCAVWNSSNAFEGEKKEPRVYGVSILFDILAFPKHIRVADRDPVYALNSYLKGLVEQSYVLGNDELPEIFQAENDCPAIYTRLASNKAVNGMGGWSVRWFDCSLSIHIIAPDPKIRESILQTLVHRISLDGECLIAETSPLLFEQLSVNYGVNPLFDGQLTVTGRYAVLNYDEDWQQPMLNIAHIATKKGGV